MKKIKRLERGGKRHLLQAEVGNEIIDAVNAITTTQILPPGIADLQVEGEKAVLTLTTERAAMVVGDVASFYDVVAIPSEAGGTEAQAKAAIKDALGLSGDGGVPFTARVMVFDEATGLSSWETRQFLTPPSA